VLPILAALLGAGVVGLSWALTSGGGSEAPRPAGKVDITFEPGPADAVRLLQKSGALAGAVRTVNFEIALPTDLHVKVGASGPAAPVYEPSERTIYLPWSWIEETRHDLHDLDLLRELPESSLNEIETGAMVFVLYHELGHGLIDVLDIPIVTSEEQTADSFASVFAIQSRKGGEIIPLSAAAFSEAQQRKRAAPTLSDFADDHGFDRQRAFTELCLVYGSGPKRFQSLVEKGFLPESRAGICQFDYERALRSWRRLLGRWLTHHGALLPLPA
jgi:hypothetical protein